MKPRPFDYARPDTVEEALALLAEYGDDARVLAGGQTLIAMLNLRVVEPAALIDITGIAALAAIREVDGKVEVGAAVTQSALMQWPALRGKLALLDAALPFVGHFQTRNKGTVCGSVAHADPASEIPLSLALLEGEVVLRSASGTRVVPAAEFQQGMLATARQAEERKTGARGLRTAIEEVLLDVMYEIPSLEGVKKCIVDANVINNRSRPILLTVNEQEIDYAKTA